MQVLTQHNARLLNYATNVENQLQQLTNLMALLRERFAAKAAEAHALRKALQERGASVEELLAASGAALPPQGAGAADDGGDSSRVPAQALLAQGSGAQPAPGTFAVGFGGAPTMTAAQLHGLRKSE